MNPHISNMEWSLEPASRQSCGLWRQRLGITEVSEIVSRVETLIHPWKDLAPGNFIMQMSMNAPVPATVTQAACGWQDHIWAGRVIHTLAGSVPPPPQ